MRLDAVVIELDVDLAFAEIEAFDRAGERGVVDMGPGAEMRLGRNVLAKLGIELKWMLAAPLS